MDVGARFVLKQEAADPRILNNASRAGKYFFFKSTNPLYQILCGDGDPVDSGMCSSHSVAWVTPDSDLNNFANHNIST